MNNQNFNTATALNQTPYSINNQLISLGDIISVSIKEEKECFSEYFKAELVNDQLMATSSNKSDTLTLESLTLQHNDCYVRIVGNSIIEPKLLLLI